MPLEHLRLSREPFAEPPDPEIFFQEAGRIDLLRAVYADLERGSAAVKITGPEGAGKTTLCLLLSRLLPAEFQAVYFAQPGGSFDELLQAIRKEFGLTGEAEPLAALLERQEGKRVLLIIDAAEKMFSAALERLLRAVSGKEQERRVQLVLAGSPPLNDHLATLAAHCPELAIQASHALAPLTEEETGDYLAFRLRAAGLAAESRTVFSGGAVRSLFRLADGDLRLLHRLADEALRRTGQNLPVLANHVSASSSLLEKKNKPPLINLGRVLKASAAGAALIVVIALLYFHRNDVLLKEQEQPALEPPAAVLKQDAPLAEPTAALPAEQPAAEQETKTMEPVELFPAAPPEDFPADAAVDEEAELLTAATEEQPAVSAPAESVALPPPDDAPVAAEQEAEAPAHEATSTQETDALPAEPLYTPAPPAEEPAQAPAEVPAKKIIELVPGKKKVKPTAKATEPPLAPVPPAVAEPPAAVPSAADRLYQEMLTAGSRLKSRPREGRYTIHLMTLSSPEAPAQLKEMIVRDEYLEHKEQLQAVRRKTASAGIVVFYGSYASMEEAKAALDNMPLFLRKHHPYILPVDGALTKAVE